MNDAFARQLRIDGVIIGQVTPGSGAAAAGLEGLGYDRYGRLIIGDIIVGLEDQPVTDQTSLYRLLDRFKIGDRVRLKVTRPGQRAREITVELTPSA